MVTPQRRETGRFADSFDQVGTALDKWLADERIDPLRSTVDWQSLLSGPVPQQGIGADATLDEFVNVVLPHGPKLTSEASWGWITTGPSTVPTAVTAASMVASPQRQTLTAFNLLEETALEWLVELCGLPSHMKGVFSSGGSTANLIALGAARQWALEQRGIDPAGDGLDSSQLAIYTSTQAHHTVQRSAGVLGMGRTNVRTIRTDDQMRLDVDALADAMRDDAARGVYRLPLLSRLVRRTPDRSTRSRGPARSQRSTAPGSTSTARTDCQASSTNGCARSMTDLSSPTRRLPIHISG